MKYVNGIASEFACVCVLCLFAFGLDKKKLVRSKESHVFLFRIANLMQIFEIQIFIPTFVVVSSLLTAG